MPDSPADSAAGPDDPAELARRYVLESRAGTVGTVLRCADRVAEAWDDDWTADPSEVAVPLRRELDDEGAWTDLPDALAGAVRATGESLSATPVADPPYVTATSRGPMLRATLSEGRLVVLLHVFEVERVRDGADSRRRAGPVQYRRGPTTPDDAVRAAFK